MRSLVGANTDTIVPADMGFLAWAGDPASFPSSATTSGGTLHLVKIYNKNAITVSSVWVVVGTARATLTNVGFALYSAAGALLTSSVNTNGATATAFQSTGLKQVTFSSAQTIPAGGFFVGLWTTGSTQPALARTTLTNVAMLNGNLASPNLRFSTANTGLTTAAPSTFSAQTTANAYWAAVS